MVTYFVCYRIESLVEKKTSFLYLCLEMFVHHSINGILSKPILRRQSQDGQFYKPIGIWVSPISDRSISEWSEWVDENGFGFNGFPHRITLNLNKIFQINNSMDLKNFVTRFASKPSVIRYEFGIDWERVSCEYDGFLVTNYLSTKRLVMQNIKDIDSYLWFLGLDVNGGCIWNPDAILSIISI